MEHIHSQDDEFASLPGVAAAAERTPSFAVFTAWCAGILAAGAVLVTGFVVVADPYHQFGLVDAEGFNRIKPLPEQYREQIKVAQAKTARPKALLLGNSRVEVGFDPDSGPLHSHGYPAYNLALAGTSLAVSQRVFEEVRRDVPPPAMAVVGVEFLDFLVQPDSQPASQPANAQSWQWRVDTVFSLKSLMDAARTLSIQKAPEVETLTASGHTPLLEYRKYARQEGYNAIFKQRAQENAKNLVRKPANLFLKGTGSSASIDRLREMLARMAQDGTEVNLVIYPYHAQLMAMFEEAGLQPTMEEWKRVLVQEVDAMRRRQPNARIHLWDFSGFDAVQCEAIPAAGDLRSTTKWYWEAGHFKSATGDLILRRVLGEEVPFGIALTAQNLEQNRQRIAAERARCLGSIPEIFADARATIADARTHAH
ncbi:hypothetical protein SRABI118_02165 [Massilia sp. Bi118]|uniref:hypothetical protein n=1 Tax=Massilia sp. Bi118 TaxID=2822346 RepID=UPI001D3180AD|nr:hypothetical protein [Massilia sp. Bi118]CAH0218524.1 hypothetical protein SRABI118_02165 [Massilia sp. Bi118]